MRLNHRILSRRQSNPRHFRFGWWFYLFLACALSILASIPLLIFYDAVLVELHIANHSNETTKTVLFMGWVTSLKQLNDNWVLEKEMEEFCSTYDVTKPRGYGYKKGQEGGMRVHIFYREENEAARHEIQAVLSQQGCSASFTHEQVQNGVDLTKTRSYERELVLQDSIQYDAVVNIDLDNIISLPSLSSFEKALAHAISNPGALICANEQKTWHMLIKQSLWWRPVGSSKRSERQQQGEPLEDAEFCAEGFAMYSWNAWSSTHCNFDSESDDDRGGQLGVPPTRRGKDQGAHINFQRCLKEWHDETWIGVQPDLVIWRKLWWCPWVTLLCFGVLVSIAWEHLSSVGSDRRSGFLPAIYRNCTKASNKHR